MTHTLPELPWAMDALEPNYLKSTLEFHYSKHHNAYVTKLNEALAGTGKENEYNNEDFICIFERSHD